MMEIANTFAYLYVGFHRPIVYSYMSSSHFLLDEHFVPKLFNFSCAECILEGETHIKDARVRGFIGFMAPEQFRGVLDERCDVYGFGALLLELLIGQKIDDLVCNCASKSENCEFSFETENETKDEDLENCSSKNKVK